MTVKPRILVTGASGFIGKHLVRSLSESGYLVRAAARQPVIFDDPNVEGIALGDMSRSFAAEYVVRGVDAVIHAAGMAHARAGIPDAAYTAINVDATRQLARAARAARVKRFVLISSVRAQVGASHDGVVTEATPASPTDAYGRSKIAAEAITAELLAGSGTHWTVLRPVLVYGPGVKGNMAALMRLAASPYPLPFGAMKGRRSLLSIGNLLAAIKHVLGAEAAKDASFIVADSTPVTIADIIRALRKGRGHPSMLLPIPEVAIAAALRMAGKAEIADRLSGDLVADAGRLRQTGWQPVEATAEALASAARG
ncbi:NAD-dependent epimerase/dehydratase [Hyphomicrobium denitrificans 1NES1]|uniref:NAD-dependent epimerase/dehydratase n=1 Tax=Hyphomicrobium denitrificans 1NES1 TaxID=670307 RepID=N0BFC3_9HYPH|nr:NAD-dependent epimerase/dehydratase family protein [Hyphomicrobium denitrificans]AGK59146.1 NAD-dependent epimerase/dehydratase [Hyphomicrobium denitrificans 1NES1]